MCIIRLSMYSTLEGKELYEFLKQNIEDNIKILEKRLAKYDNIYCTEVWRKFIWHLEEFINIFYELNAVCKTMIFPIPIEKLSSASNDALYYEFQISIITQKFGIEITKRFIKFINLFLEVRKDLGIYTIKDLFDFCQSRRLHYLSILYLLSRFANGGKRIELEESINEFQEYVETHLASLTSAYHGMIRCKILPDFYLKIYPSGKMEFSEYYTPLEDGFLEPQTLTSIDILKYCPKIDTSRLWDKPINSLYSIEEYDAIIHNDGVYYEYFNLIEIPYYQELCAFLMHMKKYFTDGYHVEVTATQYQELCNQFPKLTFYKDPESFFDIQNNRFCFFKLNNTYYTTYFLLIRYYTNEVKKILLKIKRYQIKAGFFFEDKVTEMMKKNGFKVEDNCKRINNKEFDVVCTKNGTIYNFQCKNNYYDVTQIDIRSIDKVIRYNNRLAKYYDRAIIKEYCRQNLLKEKLKLDNIEHYVISRYPIITANKRVIAFKDLDQFLVNLDNRI